MDIAYLMLTLYRSLGTIQTMSTLSMDDINPSIRSSVYTQSYDPQEVIEGVKIVELKEYAGEDGDFAELFRLNEKGESDQFPGFKIAQINRSSLIPGTIKAWHLHLKQDEVWYVPDDSKMLTALWDVRVGSPTQGKVMRIPIGGISRRMVYIPRGVAHGITNFSKKKGMIIYFVSAHFDSKHPDEHRIPWDSKGADFWQAQRD